jgi:hypothetical protein
MKASSFTVISWCNQAYKYLSKGLEADCKRLGYDFHLYEIERDFPSLISAWCNHPRIIRRGVQDFGNVLFLDVECRIVQSLPGHWKAPLVSVRHPLQHFWITYNTGTVMANESCLQWIDAWISIMEKWDMGNLPDDAYIYWPNDICDELAFNAAITAFGVEPVTPLLEYVDRHGTAEIARGLWKNDHTIVQHPTIHHWPKEHDPIECKKLFWQNFPGDPETIASLMQSGQPSLEKNHWIFDPQAGQYGPAEYYELHPRSWSDIPVELTSAQR